jgi:glutaredoxin
VGRQPAHPRGRRRLEALDRRARPVRGARPATGDIIVYKTDWCGVCKKLTAYLDRKGVKYVAKDIEKDPAAAGELLAKSKEKGFKMGSVPVVDVRGEIMVGFDRARLEKLL